MNRPNGMQGSWTRPVRTSPVPAAILAALPPDGSPITRKDLIATVQRTVPFVAVTIDGHLRVLTHGPNPRVHRVGYGLYRLNVGGTA